MKGQINAEIILLNNHPWLSFVMNNHLTVLYIALLLVVFQLVYVNKKKIKYSISIHTLVEGHAQIVVCDHILPFEESAQPMYRIGLHDLKSPF